MPQAYGPLPRLIVHGAIVLLLGLVVWARVPASHHAPADGTDAASGELRIAGSATMRPLVAAIAARYQRQHPGVQVHLTTADAQGTLAALDRDEVDIVMVEQPLVAGRSNVAAFPIARDGIAAVVHHDNRVDALRRADLTALLRGTVDNWQALGGADAGVVLLGGSADGATTRLLDGYAGVDPDAAAGERIADTAQRLARVAADPHAITFVPLGEAEAALAAGAPIKLLRLDGVDATSRNVRRGQYPLTQPLALATRTLPTGLNRSFVEFALSSEVTDLVLAQHYTAYLD